jgi:hypothetical protein
MDLSRLEVQSGRRVRDRSGFSKTSLTEQKITASRKGVTSRKGVRSHRPRCRGASEGSLENRTRLIFEDVTRIGAEVPGLLPFTRMNFNDGTPFLGELTVRERRGTSRWGG